LGIKSLLPSLKFSYFELMRKLFLITVLVFAVMVAKSQIKFGLEAGFNLTTWVGTFKDYNYKSGFIVGGRILYYLRDDLLLQSGISYSSEGWKDLIKINGVEVNQLLSLNYLIVPVDVGVFGFGDRYRGLRFNFGFAFKYLLNSKLANDINGGKEPAVPVVEFNNFDVSFRFGMDYKIDENIGLMVQGYIGILKINKTLAPEIKRMYNQGFRFGLYYIF